MLRTNYFSLFLIGLLLTSCSKDKKLKRDSHFVHIQNDSVRAFNDSSFLALKNIPNDSLYVINFWAKRSQKSLKNRNFLNQFKNPDFQLIQINLDYKTALSPSLNSFKKNDFYYKPSSFSLIDTTWDGLLPATLFITKDTLFFKTTLLNDSIVFY